MARDDLSVDFTKFLESCSLRELEVLLVCLATELHWRAMPGTVPLAAAYGMLHRYRVGVADQRRQAQQSR